MNKKNAYIRITLLLLCITATTSFYLHSSAYEAPGTRRRGYTGPKRLRQKPKTSIAPAEPTQVSANVTAPIAPSANTNQVAKQTTEEPQAEQPTNASQAMQAQAARQQSSPGWLMTAYIVLLSTLNKAFGAATELGYKPLAQSFMERQKVLNAKNEAPTKAASLVKSGDFDQNITTQAFIKMQDTSDQNKQAKIWADAAKQLNLPDEKKIAISTEQILKKLEPLEQQVSFGSMAKDAAYLALFNTATRVIGGLIGFGATMLLQSLVPTQGQ